MEFIDRIVKFTEGLLDRSLTQDENKQLVEFTEVNENDIKDKSEMVQIATLASRFADSMDTKSTNLTSFLGINDFDRLISEINPSAKRKRAYMCLDSRYARFNKECTKLTWEFTNNLNVVNNSTNVVGPIRDIKWIRMHSLVVRKFSSTPQRATILIEELSAQAFIMPNGRRFHFVGLLNDLQMPIALGVRNAVTTSTAIPDFTIFDKYELLAGYKFNDGYYRFNKPITTLNEITISVGNPDTLVVLPKYEFLNVTVLNVDNFYIDLDMNEPHYYINNNGTAYLGAPPTTYSVFVDGFSSSIASFNNYVNSNEFTVVEILSDTKIRLRYDQAPAGVFPAYPPVPILFPVVPPAPWKVSGVRFNSYRVIMNFEMEYVVQ